MTNQRPYYSVQRIRFEFRKSQVSADTSLPSTIYAAIYIVGQPHELRSTGIRATREDFQNRTAPRPTLSAKELNEKLVLWDRSAQSESDQPLAGHQPSNYPATSTTTAGYWMKYCAMPIVLPPVGVLRPFVLVPFCKSIKPLKL